MFLSYFNLHESTAVDTKSAGTSYDQAQTTRSLWMRLQDLYWWNRQSSRVRLQEHWQEVSQRDVKAYTSSTSRLLASEQSKSAVTDHAITFNHVIDWDQAKVVDREAIKLICGLKKWHMSEKNKTSRWTKTRGPISFHISITRLFTTATSSGEQKSTMSFRGKQQQLPNCNRMFGNRKC